MTSLTLFLNQSASSTASTADQMLENASTGGTLSNKNTNLTSGTTGWITIYSQGNPTAQTGAGSQPAMGDNGWIDDATTLQTNHLNSGSWSFALGFETTTTGTFIADFHFRFFQRTSGGTRTLIGEAIASAQTIVSGSYTVLTPSVSASASATFATGDRLGLDVTANITTNGTTGNLRMQASSSATLGNVNAEVVTAGYSSVTTSSRTIPATAVLITTNSRTIPGTAALITTNSRTIPATVALLTTNSRTIPSTADIALTHSRTIPATACLDQPVSRTIPATAALMTTNTRTIPATSALLQTSSRTIPSTAALLTTNSRTIPATASLTIELLSGGFTLFANGTGTVQYDSFRVTEYPDPSLSLSPITPRVGNTSVLWNALTPTNTTLGVDISLDGVNWTDVTSGNGNNLPGIFSQPDPTTDGFGTNTSANYTNTFRTGGSAGTWTYDTANSRLVATSGTNALYLYNAISRADVDFFTDLDQSDAGGLVWRYNDQSNFYYLLIGDSLASSGTRNTITLYKVASNVQTQLATAPITYNVGPTSNFYTVTFARGTYRRLRVSMLGGVITVYIDGIQLLTYTDNSPLGAGKMGLFNNGGTVGSRYYQLWMTPVGDYVTGTPPLDIVTSTFVYTRQRLSTTDPTVTPQMSDITTLAVTPEIGIGGTIPNVSYNAAFISQNFDDLVKASGPYTWWFNPNLRFNFKANGTLAAPWILQSTPGLVMNVDLEVNNDLECDMSNDLYRNRMTILGAQGTITPNPATFAGDGSTTTFTLGYPLAAAPLLITLNGVSQTFALKGSTGAQWYYAFNDAVIQQDTSQAVLQATDTLTILYTGFFSETVTVDDTTQQALFAAISGGTGIVEAVEDHSSDNPPMTEAQAIAYAQALINRYAVQGRTLIFDTSRDGLAVGQTLSIFLQEFGIWDGQFLITEVDTTLMKAVGDQQLWWYKVTASELPRQASWAKLLASGIGLQ